MCCLHFQNRSCYKQLAKQLIIQGANEQDTENETENEELPGFFSFKSITDMRGNKINSTIFFY